MGYNMATPHTPGQKHAPGTRVVYKNGVEAVVQEDGRHRIVSSSAAAAANARKTPRYSKALGPRGAARAFNAYYRNKSYKSPRSKKAAMTRDLCHGRKAKYVRRTTAYKATRKGRLTGPGHYDYPGVDDGSRCPQRGGYESTEEEELFGGYESTEEEELSEDMNQPRKKNYLADIWVNNLELDADLIQLKVDALVHKVQEWTVDAKLDQDI